MADAVKIGKVCRKLDQQVMITTYTTTITTAKQKMVLVPVSAIRTRQRKVITVCVKQRKWNTDKGRAKERIINDACWSQRKEIRLNNVTRSVLLALMKNQYEKAMDALR